LYLGYQFGSKAHPGGNGTIAAFMTAGDYFFYFLSQKKLMAGAGFEVFSGDDGSDESEINYFFDNYSSKHRTFGHMDFFKNPTGIKSKGMQDFIIHLGATPVKELMLLADLHYFRLEKTYTSAKNGKPAHNLGFETDSNIKYTLRKGLTGELGIDFFIPDAHWKNNLGDISTFIYLAFTAKI